MSILLDALRKSENSQKPVAPPTIHGNDHQFQEPRTIKSSYVVLLVVLALIVIGWLLWQQYHNDEGGYSPPVDLPAGNAANRVPTVPGVTKSQQTKPDSAKPEVAKTGQTTTAPAKAISEKNTTAKGTGDGRPRTPVEVFEMTSKAYDEMTDEEKDAEKAMRRIKAAEARALRAANELAIQNKLNGTPSKQVAGKSKKTNTRKTKQPETSAETDQRQAADNRKNTSASTQEYRSPEPDLIGYWELPDSVRRGVPEIKFSVLVYADDPANRFVLVNGERLVEGQELTAGVEVEQIRRDGVVFSYQMYTFFIKR